MTGPADYRFAEWNSKLPRAAVFVEGESDRIAVATMATRLGVELSRAPVLSTGGSSGFSRFVKEAVQLGGSDVRLLGLCDEAETADVVDAIRSNGLGDPASDADLPAYGFYVCRRDLEDELIRAVGPELVVDVIRSAGDRRSLQRLQDQPAWRAAPLVEQLRRFMSSQSGRKARYAQLLCETVDLARAPAPLVGLVSDIGHVP